jgi:predicted RNA-binding Zn-ribbon protein involved in translation (DUF1610 family)
VETICQACGYQRKPTDQAPDWECPSCGKAYVKTSHDSQGSLSGYAQSYSSDSGYRMGEASAYQKTPSGFTFGEATTVNKKPGWILGAVIGILLVLGIPILSNPSATSAILLHGEMGFLCLFLLALGGVLFVIRRMNAGVDLNDPMSKFAFLAKSLALFCAAFFIVMTVWLRGQERTEVNIQRNGQRVTADVVRIYRGSCGKRSCSIDVEYAFRLASDTDGTSQPIHGYARLGSSNRPNDPDILYARTNQHLPIAYEVDNPQVSALNFNDDIFRVDHGARYRSTVATMAGVCLAIFLIGIFIGGISYWLNAGK